MRDIHLLKHPNASKWVSKVRARRVKYVRAGGTFDHLRDFDPEKYQLMRHCEWLLIGAIKYEAWEEVSIHAGGIMWTWDNALHDLHKRREEWWLSTRRANARASFALYDPEAWSYTNWPGEAVDALHTPATRAQPFPKLMAEHALV
jgi:hypothetical protein